MLVLPSGMLHQVLGRHRCGLCQLEELSVCAALFDRRKRACAGMLTGGFGQFVASPTDVVKIRIQADGRLKLQGKEARYRGALHAFRSIAQKEGMAGERRTTSPC